MEHTITMHDFVMIGIFLVGYLCIALEQYIHINKAAVALLMALGCWTVLFFQPDKTTELDMADLSREMFNVSQVLFFLLGALTIVEVISAHQGFQIVTKYLHVESKLQLLWIVGFLTFFMSAVLDNLTTTIVMVSIVHKLLEHREDRLYIGSCIVVAANAGGVWTPIGDVATTVLWINNRVSTLALMRDLFLPSLACFITFFLLNSYHFRGKIQEKWTGELAKKPSSSGVFILFLGIACLVFVPIFKILTGLPPFLGMMLGLAIMWVVTDLMHRNKEEAQNLRLPAILTKVDMTVILFYLGILLSIYALDATGVLKTFAHWLYNLVHPVLVVIFIGLASSMIDNVTLVAATIGMFDLSTFAMDSEFWQLMAYTAGTGGSILIIGSAAGVGLMALEKVDFMWYTRKMAFKALLSFFAGIVVYLVYFSLVK